MATGTLSPDPKLTFFDTNGDPLVLGKVYTYLAGTTTAAATYNDVDLAIGHQNANPIILDAAGRCVIYLSPGASYKYVVQDSTGASVWTQDNISSVPGSAASLEVTGTAGEALTAGQAVYLSDGSGAKAAGQWFKGDSGNTYSSSLATAVGMVPASISNGSTGTIRLAGSVTGLSSLTVGGTYYISTSGAITTTAPTNARKLGIADTTSSLVLSLPAAIPNADNGVNDFRLTLTSGTPVTTADVTAATTLYCTPKTGNRIALFDTTGVAALYTSVEFSIAVPATTSQTHDIFCYANGSTPTLELLAWTNDTTRATAIVLTTTGTYTKSGDLTRRYLGSFRTTTVSGQTEDSFAKRYLWNYYHRVRRIGRVLEATDSWTYTTATWRQANAAAANQLDFVIGVADVPLHAQVFVSLTGGAGVFQAVGIGEDSTSAFVSGCQVPVVCANNVRTFAIATLDKYPAVGRHVYVWLEYSVASSTTTWYGDNADATLTQSGITGWIDG